MVAVSADARTIVWVPRAVVAHYSGDRGATWTAGAGLPVNAVVVGDRVDPGAFYVFDPAIGTPYISPNGGATFTATASGLPTGVEKLETVLDRPGHCWLGVGAGALFRSVDRGLAYMSVTTIQQAYAIGFGKAAPRPREMAAYTSGQGAGLRVSSVRPTAARRGCG